MVRAWLIEGLTNGVSSWDNHFQQLLGLVMQCSINSRAGDIARSSKYTGMEVMLWKTLSCVCSEKSLILSRRPLRYVMRKVTSKSNLHPYTEEEVDPVLPEIFIMRIGDVYLNRLPTRMKNTICPIKLLVVHGLRHGAFLAGDTMAKICSSAIARRDRKVLWAFPDRPILAAISKKRHTILELDKPATQDQ